MSKAEKQARVDILSFIGKWDYSSNDLFEVWDIRLSHTFNKKNRKLNKLI